VAEQFFPINFNNAPVVVLGKQTYGIRATIFNPDTNADIIVPDHHWLLLLGARPSTAVAQSSPSFLSNGTTTLGADQATLPPGNYSFLLVPSPNPKTYTPAEIQGIVRGFNQKHESWIDLDKPDRWATPPDPQQLEKRRLLRVPLWSTGRKAPFGGFKVVPPNTSQFKTTGFIPRAELADFGLKTPWDMPLDFNWIRARVRYSFFDWRQNQEQVLPPGLVVQALRDIKQNGKLVRVDPVGGGVTANLKDGSLFMFVEGQKTLWKEVHFSFRTPGDCFIDLSSQTTPSPDNRMKNGQRPAAGDDFNHLPRVWHSHGMRATFATSPANNPAAVSPVTPDKVWDSLHFDLAADQNGLTPTINFHLDDVVICDSSGAPVSVGPKSNPPTLFDHFLGIIKQKTATSAGASGRVTYQTDVKMKGLVIPAAVAYSVPSPLGTGQAKILEQSTRLIHFEGTFHDLRDDRVGPNSGQKLCIGARAALAGQHLSEVVERPIDSKFNSSARLGVQMHLIDVPAVIDPVSKLQLLHLLIYIPVEIENHPDDPPTTAVDFDDVRVLLNVAGESWSPGHPMGHPDAGKITAVRGKRYALVPASGNKNRIIRFRAFFGESVNDPKIAIQMTKPSGSARASTAGGRDATFLFFGSITKTIIVYFDTALSADLANVGGGNDAGDSVTVASKILTHELGHALGIMDEYCEIFDMANFVGPLNQPIGNADPQLPAFTQIDEGFSDWRPYYSDSFALMRGNALPRLRHFWHHAKNLNALFPRLQDKPYDLIHEAFSDSSGSAAVVNFPVPPNGKVAPWIATFQDVKIPAGRGQIALFPLSQDEGTIEKMFQTAGLQRTQVGLPSGSRMDAVLLVRSRLGFIFDPIMPDIQKAGVLDLRFHNFIYDSNYAPLIRFMLKSTLPSARFQRIGILLQPLYAIPDDTTPTDDLRSGAIRTSDLLNDSDIVFDISISAAPPRPNPFLRRRGQRVNVMLADFKFELAMRMVLGINTVFPDGKTLANGALIKQDFNPIARLVEQQLNEPVNTRFPDTF